MKTLKILIALCIMFCFAAGSAQAQALVVKGQTWYLGSYQSTETLSVVTPSGNVLINLTFQLDMDDPNVPEKGVNKIRVTAIFNTDEGIDTPVDTQVIVTSDGKAKAVFHVNGAGDVTPPDK